MRSALKIIKLKKLTKKKLPSKYKELKLTVEDDKYALSWGARNGVGDVLKYKLYVGWLYIVEVE